MKGIIFTEFLELVEEKFGLEMVDNIISSSDLESAGIYTSVGTYSFSEMLQLLQHLSENTGLSIDALLLVYSSYNASQLIKALTYRSIGLYRVIRAAHAFFLL